MQPDSNSPPSTTRWPPQSPPSTPSSFFPFILFSTSSSQRKSGERQGNIPELERGKGRSGAPPPPAFALTGGVRGRGAVDPLTREQYTRSALCVLRVCGVFCESRMRKRRQKESVWTQSGDEDGEEDEDEDEEECGATRGRHVGWGGASSRIGEEALARRGSRSFSEQGCFRRIDGKLCSRKRTLPPPFGLSLFSFLFLYRTLQARRHAAPRRLRPFRPSRPSAYASSSRVCPA